MVVIASCRPYARLEPEYISRRRGEHRPYAGVVGVGGFTALEDHTHMTTNDQNKSAPQNDQNKSAP